MPTRTLDLANNIVPFKGRDIHSAAIVFVYRNLHHNTWSIMAHDGPHKGQIVGHATHLVLDLPRWRVNETGRQRVIAERQKNVHAGVYGMLADVEPMTDDDETLAWERVSYNPYAAGHFYLSDIGPHGSKVSSSRWAMFDVNGKAWAA